MKNILLLMPRFQGLYKLLAAELERQNYRVCWVDLSMVTSFMDLRFVRTVMKIFGRLPFLKKLRRKSFYATVESAQFDTLLVIGGFFLHKKYINKIKAKNPRIKTIIFYWDSFAVWDFSYSVGWFDKHYSFDPQDCENHRELQYMYNFCFDTTKASENATYDICHIGSLYRAKHLDRLRVLFALKRQAEEMGVRSYIHLIPPPLRLFAESQWVKIRQTLFSVFSIRNFIAFWQENKLKKSIMRSPFNIICSDPIPIDECKNIEKNSRCIVDIPVCKQSGYTIRFMNAVAAGQKIITTNTWCRKEPFYHPNNICIIDKDHPVLDKAFLSLPAVEADTRSVLRAGEWLAAILTD